VRAREKFSERERERYGKDEGGRERERERDRDGAREKEGEREGERERIYKPSRNYCLDERRKANRQPKWPLPQRVWTKRRNFAAKQSCMSDGEHRCGGSALGISFTNKHILRKQILQPQSIRRTTDHLHSQGQQRLLSRGPLALNESKLGALACYFGQCGITGWRRPTRGHTPLISGSFAGHNFRHPTGFRHPVH